MFKKLILALALSMLVFTAVSADSMLDTAERIMDRLQVEENDNQDVLRKFKNWYYINDEHKPVLAKAANAGLFAPKNNYADIDSGDLTPLVNGVISYGLKNKGYKIVTGAYNTFNVAGAAVNSETVFIDGAPIEGKLYSCLVDKKNNAAVLWEPRDIKLPTVLRGELYISYDNRLVLKSLQRSSYEFWIDVNKQEYTEIEVDFPINMDYLNSYCLDKTIYILADCYDNKIKPLNLEMGD